MYTHTFPALLPYSAVRRGVRGICFLASIFYSASHIFISLFDFWSAVISAKQPLAMLELPFSASSTSRLPFEHSPPPRSVWLDLLVLFLFYFFFLEFFCFVFFGFLLISRRVAGPGIVQHREAHPANFANPRHSRLARQFRSRR